MDFADDGVALGGLHHLGQHRGFGRLLGGEALAEDLTPLARLGVEDQHGHEEGPPAASLEDRPPSPRAKSTYICAHSVHISQPTGSPGLRGPNTVLPC